MSALHMEKITEHSKDFHRTESLYVRAFPANERTPICGLMRHDGHDFVGFYDKDENFCGFASRSPTAASRTFCISPLMSSIASTATAAKR